MTLPPIDLHRSNLIPASLLHRDPTGTAGQSECRAANVLSLELLVVKGRQTCKVLVTQLFGKRG